MISYDMNPAQSITATGKISSISVDMKKFGLPDFNIRAKIYSYVPTALDTGFPLPLIYYVGQSSNVISAAGLTGVFATKTFNFNGLSVSGQWTIVFSYESEIIHDNNNYVNFSVGFPDIYAGGTFIYYLEQTDNWVVFETGDLVFSCTYCNEGELVTTTTTTGLCLEYILVCSVEGQQAQFLVTHCEDGEETITVDYGQPQVLCLQYPPTPLDENGWFDSGRTCGPTTTTTTLPCTIWELVNHDQTLIVWSYFECGSMEESYVYQESGADPIYICSLTEPVPSGNGHATNTDEPCLATPTTTTTTEMPN